MGAPLLHACCAPWPPCCAGRRPPAAAARRRAAAVGSAAAAPLAAAAALRWQAPHLARTGARRRRCCCPHWIRSRPQRRAPAADVAPRALAPLAAALLLLLLLLRTSSARPPPPYPLDLLPLRSLPDVAARSVAPLLLPPGRRISQQIGQAHAKRTEARGPRRCEFLPPWPHRRGRTRRAERTGRTRLELLTPTPFPGAQPAGYKPSTGGR